MLFSDIEQGGINPKIPDLTARVPGRTTDVFHALANRMEGASITISELAEEVDRSVSTVSRHVDTLAREGLVQKYRDKQSKKVSLTVTGRLFARNQSFGES
jgi:DNA-binding MarR family transcriptional regulator